MYLAMVVGLMVVLPIASILIDVVYPGGSASLIFLIGKWFVFWAVGVRLLLAGIRQALNPSFTAEKIFAVKDPAALIIVQELGFANLSIGVLGVLSLFRNEWIVGAAITGGLFYGLAGIRHVLKGDRNTTENIAMISDLFMAVVLAAFVAATLWRGG